MTLCISVQQGIVKLPVIAKGMMVGVAFCLLALLIVKVNISGPNTTLTGSEDCYFFTAAMGLLVGYLHFLHEKATSILKFALGYLCANYLILLLSIGLTSALPVLGVIAAAMLIGFFLISFIIGI